MDDKTKTESTDTATIATEAKPTKKAAKAKAQPKATAPKTKKATPKDDTTKIPKWRGATTMTDVCAGYMESLKEADKSEGTCASYRAELVLACNDIGADTDVKELKPARVLKFFLSDGVTKKRNGKHKSPLSIDKTRRVLRQALVWAAKAGIVETAPVPELPDEKR